MRSAHRTPAAFPGDAGLVGVRLGDGGAVDGPWRAHPLPGAQAGRFIRLATGDLDGDGDVDLAAGSLAMQPVPDGGRLAGWIENGLPFVVWERE